jgi:GTP-binding protein HflX
MLTDTVGFVRDLPHHLVASFRATLEEAMNANLLLVVMDIADPQCEMQLKVVHEVLDGLQENRPELIEIPRVVLLNKADRLPDNRELLIWKSRHPDSIIISALHGEGLGEVVERVLHHMKQGDLHVVLSIPLHDSRTISFLENRAEVLSRDYTATHARIEVRVGRRQIDQLRSQGASIKIEAVG